MPKELLSIPFLINNFEQIIDLKNVNENVFLLGTKPFYW